MSELICYVNGKYTPLDEASISVQDLGVLRGYGVFDFLRTYNGQPFHLKDHLNRLQSSAQQIELDLPHPLEKIEEIVLETLRRNSLPEANIRIVVTGGTSIDSIMPEDNPSLIVIISPLHKFPADYYEQGVKVITVELDRYLPTAKTINYLPAVIALKKAKRVGGVEALYVNEQGHILEATTSNFLIFHGSQLIVPKDEILFGITRDVVIPLAEDCDFEVIQRPITFADVEQATEAFLTSSNKEIMPVRQVNEQVIGADTPGPNTRILMEQFKNITWN